MKKTRFPCLRWNSKWMLLSVPLTVYGLYCLLGQFWYGFHPVATLMGLFCMYAFAPCVWYGLQTIHITPQTVMLKLGPIVLRQISVSDIRTITSVSVSLVKGNIFNEIFIILSPQPLGEIIDLSSKNPRGALHKYFDSKMKHIYMHPREGIWLQDTDDEIEKSFPNAENFILKSDKNCRGEHRSSATSK